jgi:branched-chain amino acid transport system substrate-binding protein
MRKKHGQLVVAVVVSLALLGAVIASTAAGSTARTSAPAISKTSLKVGLKFTKGKLRKANSKLAPLTIGYSIMEGGTTSFPEYDHSTSAAVRFINDYMGGVDGHPLRLDKCVIQTEEDGQKCAAQFLGDKVPVINAALAVVGNRSMYETLGGKIPVVVSQGSNPADPGASHVYEFDGGAFSVITAMATDIMRMKAKNVAMLSADNPTGRNIVANLIGPPLRAAGIKLTAVYTSATATTPDFVSAAQAAGASGADVLVSIPINPGQCIQTYDAFNQLGLLKKPTISTTSSCTDDTVREHTGGGPEGWHLFGQGVSPRVRSPQTTLWKQVMTHYGEQEFMYRQQTYKSLNDLMTIAKFGNELGFKKISSASLEAKIVAFRGPSFMVPGNIKCTKNPDPAFKALCGDSAAGVMYSKGKWVSLGGFKAVTFAP